jgi:hypothetical protein
MSNKLPPFTQKNTFDQKKIPIDINGMFGDNLRFDTNDKCFGGDLLLNYLHQYVKGNTKKGIKF